MIRERDPSNESDDVDVAEDAELALVLEAYLADIEAGRPADPERLLAAHPAIARQLRACLQVMNLADRMVDPSGSASGVRRPMAPLDSTISPAAPSSLTTLGPGQLPHVNIRELSDEPEPLIQPRSAEMPASNGDSLGRYQIQGEIARGGMGAILRGRDIDLGRELAIKVMLESHRGDSEVVRRFIEEAQIGGQLQHPGIVPVYELGTFPDRRPFFAMKLVKGRTLASLLHERTGAAQDLPRFLSIFEQICQTMAYAHARGVIHRDLKPSNVMVGSFGEVQVMDWGLAKVLATGGIADDAAAQPVNETVITTVRSGSSGGGSESQAGSVLGTPAYMAPEQARGEVERIDERADVFGLGAILCEILAGRPPYVGSTRNELRDMAARGDLADALRRLDACSADSELIGLAQDCLAVDPDQRPRSAVELARRMTAYLTGVQERLRASELARVAAQARAEEEIKRRAVADELAREALARSDEERKRRRATAALAASVLVTFGVVGSGWEYLSRQRLERASLFTQAMGEVDGLRNQAERAGDDLALWHSARDAARAAERLLVDASDGSTRSHAIKLVRDVIHAAATAENDQNLLTRLLDVRSAKADDADGAISDAAYADAFREAGIDVDSLPPATAGATISSRPPVVRVSLATALDWWAAVRRTLRRDAAGALRLTEVARLADPDPWRNRLRELFQSTASQDRLTGLKDLARSGPIEELPAVSLQLLGATLLRLGDPAAAVVVLRSGQRLYPGDVWLNFVLADCLDQLGRREEAIRYYMAARSLRPETGHELGHALEENGEIDEALGVFRDLVKLRPKEATVLTCLGRALKRRGRADEAKGVLEEAISLCRAAVGLKPNFYLYHGNLGSALTEQGKLDEAIAEYRTAIRLNPDDSDLHRHLARVLNSQGKLPDAIAEIREAQRLSPSSAFGHNDLGDVLAKHGKVIEAAAEYRAALRIKPNLHDGHHNLGRTLAEMGKIDEAIAEFRTSLTLGADCVGARHDLGAALCKLGRLDEGIAEYRAALRIEPDGFEAHHDLGVALSAQKRFEEAIAAYNSALRLKPNDARVHVWIGDTLRFQGKLDEAIAEYHEAVRLNPDDFETHNNLGTTLFEQCELDAAAAEFRTALRLKSDYPESHFNLGNALIGEGKVAEAIAEYRTALRLRPELVAARSNLGDALIRQGEFEQAIAELRDAVRLKPDLAEAHDSLGLALRRQGKLDEAIAEHRTAVRLEPNYVAAHHNLGSILGVQGKLDEAIAEYREALRLKPDSAESHKALGAGLLGLGKVAQAISEYQEALRLKPDVAETHNDLGIALVRRGMLDEAIKECRTALRLKPDFAEASNELGADLVQQGKLDEGIGSLRHAIRLKPDYPNAHVNLGVALAQQGNLEEAIGEEREALRLKPDDPGAHNNLGLALAMQGNPVAAIAEYREALRLKPDDFDARRNLGLALVGQGKLVEAIAAFREAIRFKTDNAEAHYDLGTALMGNGEMDEAITAYREALRYNPDHAEAHCNLGHSLLRQHRFADALAEFKRGHELGSKHPNWQYPSSQWVHQAERMVELDRKLPTVLGGHEKPADAAESLVLAQMCYDKKLHGASARLWAEGFQAQPKLAEDLNVPNRYNAACAAALAGSGLGKDDPPLHEEKKAHWRNQALDWLKADLTAWSKLLESGSPQARQAIPQTLQQWKADTDLAELRDAPNLVKLPDDEQKACRALWAEVDALLAKSQGTNTKQSH